MSDLADLVRLRLPDGWRCETIAGRRGIVVVTCRFGSVTINMERREFCFGFNVLGRPRNPLSYDGRGWRDRLIDDAVASLRATAPTVRP